MIDSYIETATVTLVDGTEFQVPTDEAERVIGAVYSANGLVLVGEIQHNPKNSLYAFSPCCFSSKIKQSFVESYGEMEEVLVCSECYETVLDERVFGAFLNSLTTTIIARAE